MLQTTLLISALQIQMLCSIIKIAMLLYPHSVHHASCGVAVAVGGICNTRCLYILHALVFAAGAMLVCSKMRACPSLHCFEQNGLPCTWHQGPCMPRQGGICVLCITVMSLVFLSLVPLSHNSSIHGAAIIPPPRSLYVRGYLLRMRRHDVALPIFPNASYVV